VGERQDDLFEVLDQFHRLLSPDELHTVPHPENEIVPPPGHPHEVEIGDEIDDNFDGIGMMGANSFSKMALNVLRTRSTPFPWFIDRSGAVTSLKRVTRGVCIPNGIRIRHSGDC
jgi:hypothetical protein